jgi:hypothetical protein
MTDFVVHKCRAHGGTLSEAFAESTGYVVFTATFPCGKSAGSANSAFTRVESQHHFAEGEDVVGAGRCRFNFERHGDLKG